MASDVLVRQAFTESQDGGGRVGYRPGQWFPACATIQRALRTGAVIEDLTRER
jgi:hypothetical protein